MTSLECLKVELMNRGFTKAQVESKILMGVLSVVSQSDKYTDLQRLQREVDVLSKEKARLSHEIESYSSCLLKLNQEHEAIIDEVNRVADARYKTMVDYIDAFYAAIQNCATSEARDVMKKAQLFVNTVSVDTKYDNTAFIIGLSAILSNASDGGFALETLQQINPKIPKVRMEAKPYIRYGWKQKAYDIDFEDVD